MENPFPVESYLIRRDKSGDGKSVCYDEPSKVNVDTLTIPWRQLQAIQRTQCMASCYSVQGLKKGGYGESDIMKGRLARSTFLCLIAVSARRVICFRDSSVHILMYNIPHIQSLSGSFAFKLRVSCIFLGVSYIFLGSCTDAPSMLSRNQTVKFFSNGEKSPSSKINIFLLLFQSIINEGWCCLKHSLS